MSKHAKAKAKAKARARAAAAATVTSTSSSSTSTDALIDPSVLKPWDDEADGEFTKKFEESIRDKDVLASFRNVLTTEAAIKVTYNEVRTLMLTIANAKALQQKNGEGAARRLVIQDEEQTEAIVVDLALDPTRKLPPNDEPLIQVYYHHTKSETLDMESLYAIQRTTRAQSHRGGAYQINCATVPSIGLLNRVLVENSRKLRGALGAGRTHASKEDESVYKNEPLFKRSFIVPLSKLLPPCPVCSLPAPLTCSRCKQKKYCSVACQKEDWAKHKPQCNPPAAVNYVEVNLNKESGFMTLLSPSRQQANTIDVSGINDLSKADAQKFTRFIVKAQVPMMGVGDILVYNSTKEFQTMVNHNTTTKEGFETLYNLVKTKGFLGAKAYFNAYVTPDKKLRIITDTVLPVQSW
eukprot:TRINITY_DN8409_c0_g1_i1.p1 TRINITY_DN8409_c0_g1~~TRINITY_DN8409_c0_g1_i1.p1  ORF type:complete len:409 (+),score=110.34 TRINITY_DN8409_c0_g1_i1:91-1317(+)